ncbi:methyl-accepting chemotaxis protein [Mongoliimonas terrestris]|uniref:methyl-accepting chemotaxis protein n=1 Tax=Mongoliimonas terrestris TaxID=1709001 RepID=UPI0011154560|nr:methyl-accepting chemotaxis protein [Mongoliimonas terrestris]
MLASVTLLAGLSALAIFQFHHRPSLEQALDRTNLEIAEAIGDTIDRNLFERYGDAQAFGLNDATRDPANHRNPSPGNTLVQAMNGYMKLYGLYRLTLFVDTSGAVLAVNTVDNLGRPIETAAFYDRAFTDATWFRDAMNGRYLEGPNGFTGTAVQQPGFDRDIGALYGDDGMVIVYSARVVDDAGRILGVWANFADFGLVDQIAQGFSAKFAANYAVTHLEIADAEGRLLLDMETVGGQPITRYDRDPAVILNQTLADEGGFRLADLPEAGSMVNIDPESGTPIKIAHVRTNGAYDYPGLGWTVLVRIPLSEAYPVFDAMEREVSYAVVFVVIGVAAGGLLVGHLAAKPLARTADALTALAGGTATDLPYGHRGDEIGDMARAYGHLKAEVMAAFELRQIVDEMPLAVLTVGAADNRIAYANHAFDAAVAPYRASLPATIVGAEVGALHPRLAAERDRFGARGTGGAFSLTLGTGRFAVKVTPIRDRAGHVVSSLAAWIDETRQIALAETFEAKVKGIVDGVTATSEDVSRKAETLNRAAASSSKQSSAVSASAGTATEGVETVAAAAEELVSSISEIGRQVASAQEVSSAAVTQASDSDRIIRGLADSARKIGSVVSLISDIAAQTNLLALNATIEAARAGDAGRGFAVVATEVKSLAEQTARATDEIVVQVQEIQASTGAAVDSVGSISQVIANVSEIASGIAAAVEEQGAATREITDSMTRSLGSIRAVSASMAEVDRSVSETETISFDLGNTAGRLSQQAGELNGAVRSFLDGLRTG